jgi:hypothetical protein
MVEKSDFFSKAAEIVGVGYAKLAHDSVNTAEKQIMELLNHRAMPVEPFKEITI